MTLGPPPRNLSRIAISTVVVQVETLFRVSRFLSNEPYFGKSAGSRFDDRSSVKGTRYGTCYCGFDLVTAIAETVLHDEMPKRGQFAIAHSDFEARQLVRFRGDTLVLADLTGTSLKTLVGDASLSTVVPYRLPQLWSMAIHRHPQKVDGILYMSRHVNDRKAVVLFDRAEAKIIGATYTPLADAPEGMRAIASLHISFQFP